MQTIPLPSCLTVEVVKSSTNFVLPNIRESCWKIGECHATAQRQLLLLSKFQATLGFASVNITVLGLTNPDVNLKRMQQLYLWNLTIYGTCKPKMALFFLFTRSML